MSAITDPLKPDAEKGEATTKSGPLHWTKEHLAVLTEVITKRVEKIEGGLKVKTQNGIEHIIHLGNAKSSHDLPPHNPIGENTLRALTHDTEVKNVHEVDQPNHPSAQ